MNAGEKNKAFASVLAVAILLMMWVGFGLWMLSRTFEGMQIVEGEIIRNFLEKGKYEIALIKESQEQPALLFAMMKTVLDYASHGMVTSRMITESGITTDDSGRKFVMNVKVRLKGMDRSCMRVEDVNGEYVLYWVQAEGTGMQVYKPIAYFRDFDGWLTTTPLKINFDVDNGFSVGEVMMTIYFIRKGEVSIMSGNTLLKKATTTGVYFIKGDAIQNNEIELVASKNGTAKLRGVVATIYKYDNPKDFRVVDCARDMIQDLMEKYLEEYYTKGTNFYGMEFVGSKPNVTFDPSTNYIHGSVWMSKGMNVTIKYSDGTPMVFLHSNMFTETNLSTRLGLLIDYGNTFVDHINDWLVRKIFEESNKQLKDFARVSGKWVCGPLTCKDCPDDPTPTYNKADFERVILTALNELESDLNASSARGIGWRLIYLSNKHSWESVNDNKKPCCGRATPTQTTVLSYKVRDENAANLISQFISYGSIRLKFKELLNNVCKDLKVTKEECENLVSNCTQLQNEKNILCNGAFPSLELHGSFAELDEFCQNPYANELCEAVENNCSSVLNNRITTEDFCGNVSEAYGVYMKNIGNLINKLRENRNALTMMTITNTVTGGCGLEFEGLNKNLIHVERQKLIQVVGGDCGLYCCDGCRIARSYWHKCIMEYYHRYIFKDLKILVEIIDNDYKVFDVEKNRWEPVVLRFIVNINVDDNRCDGDKVCIPDNIISNPAITPQTFGTYSVTLPKE